MENVITFFYHPSKICFENLPVSPVYIVIETNYDTVNNDAIDVSRLLSGQLINKEQFNMMFLMFYYFFLFLSTLHLTCALPHYTVLVTNKN